MTAQRQPRRLDIDDGKAHVVELHIHEPNPTPGCERPDQARVECFVPPRVGSKHSVMSSSSSAARLATALRSHDVRVMWPKQRCPPNAWISTARALFDSPMYGASIWLVSPVKITLVPSPMRVSTVFKRGRLEVLGLVDDDDLAVQRAAAQERDRLERQLVAADQLVDQAGWRRCCCAGR